MYFTIMSYARVGVSFVIFDWMTLSTSSSYCPSALPSTKCIFILRWWRSTCHTNVALSNDESPTLQSASPGVCVLRERERVYFIGFGEWEPSLLIIRGDSRKDGRYVRLVILITPMRMVERVLPLSSRPAPLYVGVERTDRWTISTLQLLLNF